ncbi:MLX-interacting protein-like isoform X2 [Petromyzon marinus]|uniref:MLX-interacting protein-like isoform X2 n=1 Tax=Petromyzon marinus TaxID=7757 RepID=UPI003F6FD1A5
MTAKALSDLLTRGTGREAAVEVQEPSADESESDLDEAVTSSPCVDEDDDDDEEDDQLFAGITTTNTTTANSSSGGGGVGMRPTPGSGTKEPRAERTSQIIHSGHFMVSAPHRDASTRRRYDFDTVDRQTCRTYRFGPRSASHYLAIDASLTRLFECMTLAYSARLVSPKWKNFKGLKLLWRDKIRLNNAIWRAWHIQYVERRDNPVCHFVTPLDGHDALVHLKPQANILEGKYWKRRIEIVIKEYHNWRIYFKKRRVKDDELASLAKDDVALGHSTQQAQPCDQQNESAWTLHLDTMIMDFSDTLFSSLAQHSFAWPNPREIAHASNADVIQPGLIQLQPSLEDYMDTMDSLQDLLPMGRPAFLQQQQQEQQQQQPAETAFTVQTAEPQLGPFSSSHTNSTDFYASGPQASCHSQKLTTFQSFDPDGGFPEASQAVTQFLGPPACQETQHPYQCGFDQSNSGLGEMVNLNSNIRCGILPKAPINDTYQDNHGFSLSAIHQQFGLCQDSANKHQATQKLCYQPIPPSADDVTKAAMESAYPPQFPQSAAFNVPGNNLHHLQSLPSNTQKASLSPFPIYFANRDQCQENVACIASVGHVTPSGLEKPGCFSQHQYPQQQHHQQQHQQHQQQQQHQQHHHQQQHQQKLTVSQETRKRSFPMLPEIDAVGSLRTPQANLPLPTQVPPASLPLQAPGPQENRKRSLPSSSLPELFRDCGQKGASIEVGQHAASKRSLPSSPTRDVPYDYVLTGPSSSCSQNSGAGGGNPFQSSLAAQPAPSPADMRPREPPPQPQPQPQPHAFAYAPSATAFARQQPEARKCSVPGSPDGHELPRREFSAATAAAIAVAVGGAQRLVAPVVTLSGPPQQCRSAHGQSSFEEFLMPMPKLALKQKPKIAMGPLPTQPQQAQPLQLETNSTGTSSSFLAKLLSSGTVLNGGLPPSQSSIGSAPSSSVKQEDMLPTLLSIPAASGSGSLLEPLQNSVTVGGHGSQPTLLQPLTSPAQLIPKAERSTANSHSSSISPTSKHHHSSGRASPGTPESRSRPQSPLDSSGIVVFKDSRRVTHISAEQKRRFNIKIGFDTLYNLVSPLNLQPNSKVSKAATLQKTVEYITKLQQERQQMLDEAQKLRDEIEELNAEINVCQQQLPATGVPITKQRFNQMRQMFDGYVRARTQCNWKFWIFSILMRPLFESYNGMVSTASMEELCRTVMCWLDQHCALPSLRPIVLTALRHLSTSTSILSDPTLVPEQVAQAAKPQQGQTHAGHANPTPASMSHAHSNLSYSGHQGQNPAGHANPAPASHSGHGHSGHQVRTRTGHANPTPASVTHAHSNLARSGHQGQTHTGHANPTPAPMSHAHTGHVPVSHDHSIQTHRGLTPADHVYPGHAPAGHAPAAHAPTGQAS